MRGHVRRHGRGWAVVIELPRGEDGRRRHKWHSGFANRRDAERARADFVSQLGKGQYVEPSRQSVRDYLLETWLPAKEVTLKPTSLTAYRVHVNQHIVPYLGALPIQSVTGASLNSLYASLLSADRPSGKGALAPGSVRKVHAVIHKALQDAVRWKLLLSNPADDADPPTVRGTRREMSFWSPAEAERFLRANEGDRLYALWRLLLATGVRRGEAVALTWSNLDERAAVVTVTRAFVAAGYEVRVSSPKSGKPRGLALDPSTLRVLREHRKRQSIERLAAGRTWQDADLIFCDGSGGALHPDRVSKLFQAAVRRAGVARIRLHDLRHTHGAHLAMRGVHPKLVQERLGHHSISMTLDQYGHLFPTMQSQAADAIKDLLG
jgi:integrase